MNGNIVKRVFLLYSVNFIKSVPTRRNDKIYQIKKGIRVGGESATFKVVSGYLVSQQTTSTGESISSGRATEP